MLDPNATMTRRQLTFGALAGVIAGGAWGAAIQSLAKASSPTISIIGKGASQIALIDTMRVRVLVFLGPQVPVLVETIPMLMTMVRQRIDVVIGSSTVIDTLPEGFMSRWHVAHAFAIPDPDALRPDSKTYTTIVEDRRLDLGDGCILELRRSTRDAWDTRALPRILWSVMTTFGTATVILAPDEHSLDVLAEQGASVVAVPNGETDHIARLLTPASVAINGRDGLDTAPATALVRIFPTDVARLTIENDQVALPSWAVPPP